MIFHLDRAIRVAADSETSGGKLPMLEFLHTK
jgi:hypothetical protein